MTYLGYILNLEELEAACGPQLHDQLTLTADGLHEREAKRKDRKDGNTNKRLTITSQSTNNSKFQILNF
jgi:hypothetical protein